MKVNLIKEAVYDLNEKKSSRVPFEAFVKMASVDAKLASGEMLPKVRIFETIDEFKQSEDYNRYDETKDVFILKNGQFCVFLKEETSVADLNNEEIKDVATHSQEDTTEEA